MGEDGEGYRDMVPLGGGGGGGGGGGLGLPYHSSVPGTGAVP